MYPRPNLTKKDFTDHMTRHRFTRMRGTIADHSPILQTHAGVNI